MTDDLGVKRGNQSECNQQGEARRYLDVRVPERFALEFQVSDGGDWITEAICLAERFERLADGSYVCSEFSSGLWIRCVADHGDYFEHVDGRGQLHRYRLVPLSVC